MNRCTYLDEILYEEIARQPLEPYRILRSYVKGQGHMGFWVFFGYPRTVLSLKQGLMILFSLLLSTLSVRHTKIAARQMMTS